MEVFQTDNVSQFKQRALQWASLFNTACYFDSNGFSDPYSAFDVLIAAGVEHEIRASAGSAFSKLHEFSNAHSGYKLGYLGYDLKNETENLTSENPDSLQFPDLYFFVPQHLIVIKGSEIQVHSEDSELVYNEITGQPLTDEPVCMSRLKIKARFSKQEYIQTVEKLKQHIQRGDVYEVNLCQEFFAENALVKPLPLFNELQSTSPTPFSTFFKMEDRYIISATPERYLSKRADKLISQPIKGTAARGNDVATDNRNKESLLTDEKEKAENVMIVDLVRNDLTRCAKSSSVRVEELFGIYSFTQVHQMISTIVCEADERLSNADIIKATFPMGSMTGAPKLRAMELIEEYEKTRRGVFSGAAGYMAPDGDFDFNVIIRSVLYNSTCQYLSFQVGSAITFEAEAEKEYQECLLKASAIQSVFQKSKISEE